MYLLAESDGPYLIGELDASFDMVRSGPFIAQYYYGDLSSDPELDILFCYVDLGPSMTMLKKEFFLDSAGNKQFRLMWWYDDVYVPGNYTIVVNITNAALVEKVWFINLEITEPNAYSLPSREDTDKKIELYFEEHTRIESASIDQFGRVKIILSEDT